MNPGEYARMYALEDGHWWYVGLHELLLAAVARESRRLGRPLAIFDAGCGTGRLMELLAAQGHRVAGCDAAPEALACCRQRGVGGAALADLNRLQLPPGEYDLITSIDVLYHSGIDDDVAVLRRLRQGLRPGGLLLLNLVAFECLRSTHDIAVQTRERYRRHQVTARLQAAGFARIQASYRVSLLFPLVAVYRLLARHGRQRRLPAAAVASDLRPPAPLINRLLLATLRLENRLLPAFPLPWGSSVFARARNG